MIYTQQIIHTQCCIQKLFGDTVFLKLVYGWFSDIQNCPIVRAECLKTIDIQSIYICKHWVCTWNIHGKNVGITFVGAFFCCPYCSNSTKTRMDATLSQEFFRFLENFDFTTNCKCKNEKSSIHDIWYTELKSIFFWKSWLCHLLWL